jgi:hypothetical protein
MGMVILLFASAGRILPPSPNNADAWASSPPACGRAPSLQFILEIRSGQNLILRVSRFVKEGFERGARKALRRHFEPMP